MSDPRFSRIKTDPRFRRPRKHQSKVVLDDRFKGVLNQDKQSKGTQRGARVDKYGRRVSNTHEQDTLRRFYRLEDDEAGSAPPTTNQKADYARGEVLMESSDSDSDQKVDEDSDADDGIVTLGVDPTTNKPYPPDEEENVEVDLDENVVAELDAQAAAYSQAIPEEQNDDEIPRTRRLAVVNLDWDHVRATHLYKIFSSLVSPTAPAATVAASTSKKSNRKRLSESASTAFVRGKVLNVRVFTSEFGKERMALEEKEGPPPSLFKKRKETVDEDEINEQNIYEFGDGEDYDEDALRRYQLERLRYYYAVVECDTVEAASYIYSELAGTELERSANVFDLSFVPDDMMFGDDFRDEAAGDLNVPYKAVEFVTDALRHSKVKLTWDEDDPERVKITRRNFTRQEIEEADFRAYIASSSSSEAESDASNASQSQSNAESKPKPKSRSKSKKSADRDRLRSLLLNNSDGEQLPEGWGRDKDESPGDVNMEITFTPGLASVKKDGEETTLEKYQRKMREKRKKRNEEANGSKMERGETKKVGMEDDFFDADSEEAENHESNGQETKQKKQKALNKKRKPSPPPRQESTAEELALLTAPDNLSTERAHFNMKSVLKAEKGRSRKGKKRRKTDDNGGEENEAQEDFVINVHDDRFKAVLEDHQFAIDPTNPHFKKTKSMAALLEERSRRQNKSDGNNERKISSQSEPKESSRSLETLVESVKRKSAATIERGGFGKRRKFTQS